MSATAQATAATQATRTPTSVERLRRVLLLLSRELRREIHPLGLSGHQVSLLGQIGRHPAIGVSALAERERVPQPSVSKMVERLVEMGLVERTRGENRRCVKLELSEKGQEALKEARARRDAWLKRHLKSLSAEERASIEQALPALERLLESPGGEPLA